MRLVTISELTTRALRRAKMVNSQFPDTGEVDRLVREAVAELYDKLIAARGAHYYITEAEAITVANVPQLMLPADFYKLSAVWVNQSTAPTVMPNTSSPLIVGSFNVITTNLETQANGWQIISPFMDQEQAGLMNATSATVYATQYRLRGQQRYASVPQNRTGYLELRPLPQGPFLVRIAYIPTALTETTTGPSPSDPVVDGINGWEDYVAIRVAMTLLDEEESSTTHLERDMARIEARIEALAASRDEGRAERLQDTAGVLDAQQLWGIPVRPRWW